MYKFTPGEHYSMQSYGVDPNLLKRVSISPHLLRVDRKWRDSALAPGGFPEIDPINGSGGFTPDTDPEPEPEPTFFEKIPTWVKISGLVAGVSGLTYAGWKYTQ